MQTCVVMIWFKTTVLDFSLKHNISSMKGLLVLKPGANLLEQCTRKQNQVYAVIKNEIEEYNTWELINAPWFWS